MSHLRATRCARECDSAAINVEVGPERCVCGRNERLQALTANFCRPQGLSWGPATADALDPNPGLWPSHPETQGQKASQHFACGRQQSSPSWLLPQFDVLIAFVLLKIELKKVLKVHRVL